MPAEPGAAVRTIVFAATPAIGERRDVRRVLSRDGFVFVQVYEPFHILATHCSLMAPSPVVIVSAEQLGADPAAAPGLVQVARVVVTGPALSHRNQSELVCAGFGGFIEVDAPPRVVKRCVAAVSAGDLWFSRRTLALAVEAFRHGESEQLTARERQILAMVGSGQKNRAIARTLGITYDTVRWHIRRAHAKLGVHDRATAAALVCRPAQRAQYNEGRPAAEPPPRPRLMAG